jgi:hypothetical protein
MGWGATQVARSPHRDALEDAPGEDDRSVGLCAAVARAGPAAAAVASAARDGELRWTWVSGGSGVGPSWRVASLPGAVAVAAAASGHAALLAAASSSGRVELWAGVVRRASRALDWTAVRRWDARPSRYAAALALRGSWRREDAAADPRAAPRRWAGELYAGRRDGSIDVYRCEVRFAAQPRAAGPGAGARPRFALVQADRLPGAVDAAVRFLSYARNREEEAGPGKEEEEEEEEEEALEEEESTVKRRKMGAAGLLVAGFQDGSVRVWDVPCANGAAAAHVASRAHAGEVLAAVVLVSRPRTAPLRLVSGGVDAAVRAWTLRGDARPAEATAAAAARAPVVSLVAVGRRWLLCGARDGSVSLLDADSLEPVACLAPSSAAGLRCAAPLGPGAVLLIGARRWEVWQQF